MNQTWNALKRNVLNISVLYTIQYNWSLILPFFLMHAKLRSALSRLGGTDAIVSNAEHCGQGTCSRSQMASRAGFEPAALWTKGDESTNEPPCHISIVLYSIILGPTAQWCPMSPHFLTRWVSRLLGLAQVSWATAHVVALSPFTLPISMSFHSLFTCHWISIYQ